MPRRRRPPRPSDARLPLRGRDLPAISAAAFCEVNHRHSPSFAAGSALPRYAQVVVAATFILLTLGSLVTTYGAGMAVPDWPLSFGSYNPAGWWKNHGVLLEHGHRLFAAVVGVLVGILCAWVWGNWRALGVAALVAAIVPAVAKAAGAGAVLAAHLRIWPAAIAFLATLLICKPRAHWPAVRWLALAAFVCVCVQATFGGLRVTRESAGALDAALILRVTHGVFAQFFLCTLVAVAALLSSTWSALRPSSVQVRRGVARLAWVVVAAIFAQLIFGVAMRHLGAGLAIPTFPHADPEGGLFPPLHNRFTDTNFAHTRIGALFVTALVAWLCASVLRSTRREPLLARLAVALLALVAAQITLGILVIWHIKPPTLTTLHVVNGAAVLATSVLLALRLSHAAAARDTALPCPADAPCDASTLAQPAGT